MGTRRIVQETGLVVIGHAAFVLGGLVLAKILAYTLGPSGYGRWVLIYSIVGVGNLLIHGPISQWFLRNYSLAKRNFQSLNDYYSLASMMVKVGMGLAIFLPVILLIPPESSLIFISAPILAGLYGTVMLLQNIFTAQRRRGLAAGLTAFDAWIKVVLVGVGFLLFGMSLSGWLFGFGICSLFALVLYWRKIPRLGSGGKTRLRQLPWTSVRKYSVPFLFTGILGALITQADKWIVAGVATGVEVGLFGAALLVAVTPFHLISFAVSQLFAPVIFDAAGGDENELDMARAYSRLMSAIAITIGSSALLILAIYLYGAHILVLFTSADFLQAEPMLLPLAASGAVFQLGQILVLPAMIANKTGKLLVPKALHTFSFLLFSLALGRDIGAMGVAYGHLYSTIIYTVAMYLSYRRYFSLRDRGGV